MVAIFYQKESLKDTLMVVLNNHNVVKTDKQFNFCAMYDDKNEVVGINIFNFSKHEPNIKNGYLKLDEKLAKLIKDVTNIDLSQYIGINNFKVGKVIQCEDIVNTHLHKTIVDIGSEKLNIICGAKNCRLDLKVVVATIGAILPNGSIIKEGMLLNNKSFGMLCSAKELNIKNKFNDEGIIELDDSYQVGSDFNDLYNS